MYPTPNIRNRTCTVHSWQSHLVPLSNHLLDGLLERVLLAGCLTDAFKLLQEGFKVHLHIVTQVGVRCGLCGDTSVMYDSCVCMYVFIIKLTVRSCPATALIFSQCRCRSPGLKRAEMSV